MTTSNAPAATHTAAPAALMRGGDHHPEQQTSTGPTGRPTHSGGSGIKSICPAGAGIINRPASNRKTANTSTKGVRDAAKPSTPLRSKDGAAAQLVEGYKQESKPLGQITMPKACVSCVHYAAEGFANDEHCPFTHWGKPRSRTPYGTCSEHQQEVFATEICASYSCDPLVQPRPVNNRPHPRVPLQEHLSLQGGAN